MAEQTLFFPKLAMPVPILHLVVILNQTSIGTQRANEKEVKGTKTKIRKK